jgi:CheY-like chemotaxis protein
MVSGMVPADQDRAPDGIPSGAVWVVEDEPASADLAVDMCSAAGVSASVFPSPAPFLEAIDAGGAPQALVLDWRLEHELSAALFMATRHRFPSLPVIYWTGSVSTALPTMIRDDRHTIVVQKADGAGAFERALDWALKGSEAAGGPAQ